MVAECRNTKMCDKAMYTMGGIPFHILEGHKILSSLIDTVQIHNVVNKTSLRIVVHEN